ncbi:MAG: hypothetical protein HC830_00680 [Bacteroidetes bacterium]|nr:hypothetical protein [Bacteroidota bacterium]
MKQNDEIFQNSTNYKVIIEKLYDNKRYFIISALIFLIAAFIYNKFADKVYENTTAVLVNENTENQLLSSKDIMQGLSALGGNKNIENEVGALKSFNLINKTVQDLGFEISYYAEQNVFFSGTNKGSFLNASSEYYKEMPFQVLIDKSVTQPLYLNYYITFLPDNKFRLEAEGENVMMYNYVDNKIAGYLPSIKIDKVFQYGEPIADKNYSFKVLLKDNASTEEFNKKCIYFKFNHPEYLTLQYQSQLTVEPTSKTASLIKITASGGHPEKLPIFLTILHQHTSTRT